jgi:hypothetical protein
VSLSVNPPRSLPFVLANCNCDCKWRVPVSVRCVAMLELVMGRHETKANHADRMSRTMSTLQSHSHSQGDRERPETNKSKLPIRFRPQLYFNRVSRSKDQRPSAQQDFHSLRRSQRGRCFFISFPMPGISLPRTTTPHYLLPVR